jgi:hypothetical protein
MRGKRDAIVVVFAEEDDNEMFGFHVLERLRL